MRAQLWIDDDEIDETLLLTEERDEGHESPSLASSMPQLDRFECPDSPFTDAAGRAPPMPPHHDEDRHLPTLSNEPFPTFSYTPTSSSPHSEWMAFAPATGTDSPELTLLDDMYPEPELPSLPGSHSQDGASQPRSDHSSYLRRGDSDYHSVRTRAVSSDTNNIQPAGWLPLLPVSSPSVKPRMCGHTQSSSYRSLSPAGVVRDNPSCRKASIASHSTAYTMASGGTPRLRRMTTEEKMSEIDAFLERDDRNKAVASEERARREHNNQETSPVISAASKRVRNRARSKARTGINNVTNVVHRAMGGVDSLIAKTRASLSSPSPSPSPSSVVVVGGADAGVKRGG